MIFNYSALLYVLFKKIIIEGNVYYPFFLNLDYWAQQNSIKHCMLDTRLSIDMKAGRLSIVLSSYIISYVN